MRSTGVWKQMWKQRLFTLNKLRTVNQRFSGSSPGRGATNLRNPVVALNSTQQIDCQKSSSRDGQS